MIASSTGARGHTVSSPPCCGLTPEGQLLPSREGPEGQTDTGGYPSLPGKTAEPFQLFPLAFTPPPPSCEDRAPWLLESLANENTGLQTI